MISKKTTLQAICSHCLRTVVALVLLSCSATLAAQRTDKILQDGWLFYPAYDVSKQPTKEQVSLPHSWNLNDVFSGMKYNRGAYIYERTIQCTPEMANKRVFLKFEAVNSVADVAINKQWVTQHKGGYTAFCVEITPYLKQGDNLITVCVSNAYRTDVAPLAGDFNIYGGITRPVHLITTAESCISPLDYASDGVYVHQDKVSATQAELTVETVLSLKGQPQGEQLRLTMSDAQGKQVAQTEHAVTSSRMSLPLVVNKPRLWNGRQDPHQYRLKVELLKNGAVVDEKTVSTGLRSFSVDKDRGFFLNGKHLDLHGVCRHEESYGRGNLYNEKAMRQDAQIIEEMGATAVRLVHYPHSRYDVEQYDNRGLVVWYELSMAGPGGYNSPGYISNPDFEASVMNNLVEMILQNYNSPSICFWALFNELSHKYDDPDDFVKRLHEKAKALDPQRLTTIAICYDQPQFQGITDLLAWNKYFGWYNGKGGIGKFMDQSIAAAAGQPVGVSEYGAAGSPLHHSFERKLSNKIHYEEYQAKVHEDNWKDLVERPQVWCKLIWQFADNPSSIRNEGDRQGMNDKGLLTYDRSIRKDAYYFYQANWSDRPMIYITSRRFDRRPTASVPVKVYTNQSSATLYLNGKRVAKGKNDGLGRITFDNITLNEGANTIMVKSGKLSDSVTWTYDPDVQLEKQGSDEKLDGAAG